MSDYLFGNTRKEQVVQEQEVIVEEVKGKYDSKILEIHDTFNTSADKLLEKALKTINSIDRVVNESKEALLNKHGFSSTKEVVEQNKINEELKLSKEQAETITYYKQNYPFNKFIFPNQVEEICKKYNLVLGGVSDYKGFVPEKNLKEIDNFKLKDSDYTYYVEYVGYGFRRNISEEDYLERKQNIQDGRWLANRERVGRNEQLEICAPIHDMNTYNKRVVDGYKLEEIILDPVVLHPVRGGGYLILTAWGDESKDPIVQNETLN